MYATNNFLTSNLFTNSKTTKQYEMKPVGDKS